MHATSTLVGKALRSMNSLLNITNKIDVPINILLNLFDSYVLSILNYGCEIWGMSKAENIERVHRKFCKWILNVKMSTNSLALYSELGRFPLYIERYIRAIKYWLKLYNEKNNNCILNTIIQRQRNEVEQSNINNNWSSKIRQQLNSLGFTEVWLFPESVCSKTFIPILRSRLRDQYIGIWRQSINATTSLYMYKELKPTFEISAYILSMKNRSLIKLLARIRLSSHNLNIESGRHRNINRQNRLCILCNTNDIEDEYHFILICSAYRELRASHIPRYYTVRPSMFKLIELLNSNHVATLNRLAVFCKKALSQRNGLFLQMTD